VRNEQQRRASTNYHLISSAQNLSHTDISSMAIAPEPVAIIGSGCRFPGDANDLSKLWSLLQDPRDLLRPIPAGRWNLEEFHHKDGDYHGHSNARSAYFLAGENTHRQFDAQFFEMNASEAKLLDPQIRILLETVYEALESTGLTIEGLKAPAQLFMLGQFSRNMNILC